MIPRGVVWMVAMAEADLPDLALSRTQVLPDVNQTDPTKKWAMQLVGSAAQIF